MSIVKKCILLVVLMLLIVPQCTAVSTVKPRPVAPFRERIINASCVCGFEYYELGNITLMVPTFRYRIIGIGNYDIVFTMMYNLSFYDNTWRNESYTLRDVLFMTWKPVLFLVLIMNGAKPMKMMADEKYMFPQEKLMAGTWSIRVNISNGVDTMFIEDSYIM